MNTPKVYHPRINVKRVTLPAEIAARLAAESSISHIPEMDLIGAAVSLLLADDGNLHTRWRAHARVLQQLRLERHN